MNKLTSEEGGGFHDEVLKKYTGGCLAATSTMAERVHCSCEGREAFCCKAAETLLD